MTRTLYNRLASALAIVFLVLAPTVSFAETGVPTNVSATPGNGQAKVTFTPPSPSGDIYQYTVTATPGGSQVSGTASPITVTGLTNGTTYTFTVKAFAYTTGVSADSSASNPVVPGTTTAPNAPTNVAATGGDGQANVTFTPGTGNNGTYQYTATSTPGNKQGTSDASPITVTGLTNGTTYTFTVKAKNAVGTSPESTPSNSVVPANNAAQNGGYSLSPVTVSGTTANLSATISNPDSPTASFAIQVGVAQTVGQDFTCALSQDLISPTKVVGASGGTITYAAPISVGTTYCAGLLEYPNLISTAKVVVPYFKDGGGAVLFSVTGINTIPVVTGTTGTVDCTVANTCYKLLAPLPGLETTPGSGIVDVSQGIGSYIQGIIRLVMGIIVVLAVAMLIFGGIEYMSTVSIGEKEGSKNRILNAVFGLVLALAAYTILNTINPNLVNININVPNAELDVSLNPGEDSIGTSTTGLTKGGSTVVNGAGNELKSCETGHLLTVTPAELDQGMGIITVTNSIQMDAAAKASLLGVFAQYKQAVAANPSLASYKISSLWGYFCRNVAGKTAPSGHAFGLSIDINAPTNGAIKGSNAPLKTDIPVELRSAFAAYGWGWGGDWHSMKDPMHFSKLQNEQGSGADSYHYE